MKFPLSKPEAESVDKPIDLGIIILHTPGHTPDELAWYDREERYLYVGDTFYEEGEDGMSIFWPPEGNMIEWAFSISKLHTLVVAENSRASSEDQDTEEGWVEVPGRVKVGAGHQTFAADAESILIKLQDFWQRALRGDVPVIKKEYYHEDAYYTWREEDGRSNMSFKAPARLMDEARKFFIA